MVALLTSLIRPSPGGAQMDYVESYDPCIVATAGTLTQNASHLVRVRVAKPLPVTTADWYVAATNAGNVNAGLFSFDGTNYNPLASTGSVAAGSANAVQSQALTAGYVLLPGIDYWLSLASDSATCTFLRTSIVATAVGLLKNRSILKAANFALAAFTTPAGSSQLPWVRLR